MTVVLLFCKWRFFSKCSKNTLFEVCFRRPLTTLVFLLSHSVLSIVNFANWILEVTIAHCVFYKGILPFFFIWKTHFSSKNVIVIYSISLFHILFHILKSVTEAEDIKTWQEYTEELYKKDLHDPGNHNGVITMVWLT